MALSTDFMPFIFDTSKGETVESVAKKRAIAEALIARSGTPRNVGEGLSSVGNALAAVMISRRARAAEEAGQAANKDPLAVLREELYPGGGAPAGGTPSAAPDVAPPTPAWSPRNPPPATENVPAGWSAGGSFAPPASAPAAQPTNLAGGADPTQFIAGLEGFTPKATWDVRQHSIGYGTRATPQEVAGQPITREEAQRRLAIETGKAANYVDSVIKIPLTPNQKTALTSLAYNVGSFGQGLINAINSGDAAGVGAWMAKYGVSDPRYAKGVGARRQKEIDLWNAGGGAPTQVASLDPSIGLPPAPTAVQNVAGALPGGGPPAPSPGVATVASALQGGGGAPAGPEMASAAPFPMGGASGLAPPFVPPSVPTGIMSGRSTPMMPTQALSPSAPQAAAPVRGPQTQAAPAVSQRAIDAALQILGNSFSTQGERAQAAEVLKMAQQQRDPAYQLKLQTERAQLDQLLNPKPTYGTASPGSAIIRNGEIVGTVPAAPEKPPDFGFTKLDDGTIIRTDPRGGTAVPAYTPAPGTRPMFSGSSAEVQGLNYLVETNQLTRDQAAQLAAGKTISGPNGEILFLTPQGVFGATAGSAPAPYGASAPSQTGSPTTVPTPGAGQGAAAAPGASGFGPGVIPVTPVGKPTDAQLTTATFADRMINAGGIIDDLEAAGLDWTQQAKADLPGWLAGGGNALVSPEFRQLAQAQRSFINAVLRRESGAVISPSEFEDAKRQYLPVPGDDPQTLANKRREREIATEGFVRASGPAYKRPAKPPPVKPPASFLPGDADRDRIWGVMPPEDKAKFVK